MTMKKKANKEQKVRKNSAAKSGSSSKGKGGKQSSPTLGKQSSTDPLTTSSSSASTPTSEKANWSPEETLKRAVAARIKKLPEPYSPVITPSYIRASEPLLRQTIGKKRSTDGQLSLFEELTTNSQDLATQTTQNNITEVGANLSVSERTALHSLQKLFSHRDYQNPIVFTVTDYLDAYGVSKKKSARGFFEYSAKGRLDALKALQALEKPIFIHWKRLKEKKYWKKGSDNKLEKTYQVVTAVEPILKVQRLFDNVTERELQQIIGRGSNDYTAYGAPQLSDGKQHHGHGGQALVPPSTKRQGKNIASKGGTTPAAKRAIPPANSSHPKLTHLKVKASEIFLADSFVLMPDHLFQTIRNKYKKISRHFLTFITLLCLSAKHQNFNPTFREETLIDNLHLRYLEQSRQKKRLEKILQEDFQRAKEVGVLQDFQKEMTATGKQYRFTLNRKAFWSR